MARGVRLGQGNPWDLAPITTGGLAMLINAGTQAGVAAPTQSPSAGPYMRAPRGGDRTANTGLNDPVSQNRLTRGPREVL